jgi:hypothetical protein
MNLLSPIFEQPPKVIVGGFFIAEKKMSHREILTNSCGKPSRKFWVVIDTWYSRREIFAVDIICAH